MPTRSPSHAAEENPLKAALAAATTTTIYVDADEPSEADVAGLLADGIHAEWDVVRGKLAVRLAAEDEMAPPVEGTATTDPAPAPTSTTA